MTFFVLFKHKKVSDVSDFQMPLNYYRVLLIVLHNFNLYFQNLTFDKGVLD